MTSLNRKPKSDHRLRYENKSSKTSILQILAKACLLQNVAWSMEEIEATERAVGGARRA